MLLCFMGQDFFAVLNPEIITASMTKKQGNKAEQEVTGTGLLYYLSSSNGKKIEKQQNTLLRCSFK